MIGGNRKMLLASDESGSLAKSKSGPRSIKFTVRTKGQTDDKPIELEIEIKDQVRNLVLPVKVAIY